MPKRNPFYGQNKEAYERARLLRIEGYGYRLIAKEVGVNWTKIKSWVKDIESDKEKAYQLASESRRQPFENLSSKSWVRKRLLADRGKQCEICKITDWLDAPISFEIDHIDGNNQNNQLENLRILCPNCHSQTPTFRRRKRPSDATGRHPILRR